MQFSGRGSCPSVMHPENDDSTQQIVIAPGCISVGRGYRYPLEGLAA